MSGGDRIYTVAGLGERVGIVGEKVPAKQANINDPWDVAADRFGNVYFAERSASRVRKIDSGGILTTVAGTGRQGFSGDGGPAIAARLDLPAALAVDGSGNLYIQDEGNARVRKVDRAGIITTVVGTVPRFERSCAYAGDGGPAVAARLCPQEGGLAFDRQGNLYIADSGNLVVRKVDRAGIITTVAGTPGVRSFAGDGGPATKAQMNSPTAVAFGPNGNMYIVDSGNSRVRMVDLRGVIRTVAGGGGIKSGEWEGRGAFRATRVAFSAREAAADPAGNIYLGGIGSFVYKLDPRGMIRKIAGGGSGQTALGDGGPARPALLSGAMGLGVGPGGDLYIADLWNYRVRVIVNTRPKPSCSRTPRRGKAPLRVSFDGSGSRDSGGAIIGYVWKFGDGSSAIGRRAAHTYREAGTYRATLTVTDDSGARVSTTCTVVAF